MELARRPREAAADHPAAVVDAEGGGRVCAEGAEVLHGAVLEDRGMLVERVIRHAARAGDDTVDVDGVPVAPVVVRGTEIAESRTVPEDRALEILRAQGPSRDPAALVDGGGSRLRTVRPGRKRADIRLADVAPEGPLLVESGPRVRRERYGQRIVDAVRHLDGAAVVAPDPLRGALARIVEESARVDIAALVRDVVGADDVAAAVDRGRQERSAPRDSGHLGNRVGELLGRRCDRLEARRDDLLAIHRHRATARSGAGASPSVELGAGGGRRSESHADAFIERSGASGSAIDA